MNSPRPYVHAPWCDQPRTEAHIACSALLGTVVLGHARLDVRLTSHIDVPPFLTLRVSDHGHDRDIALNVERLHELDVLLRQGMQLLTRSAR